MQAISRIAVQLSAARRQGAPMPSRRQNHAAATESPAPLASAPPPPAQLAGPLSPDFQAAMANSQLADLPLHPADRAGARTQEALRYRFRPGRHLSKGWARGTGARRSGQQGELPTVTEITGARTGLSAVLALPDGRRLMVPSGQPVARRSRARSPRSPHDDVRIGRAGADESHPLLRRRGAEMIAFASMHNRAARNCGRFARG